MYKIVRFYRDSNKPNKIIKRGLTLEEAQQHCRDPKTLKRNKKGETIWFDGYDKD